MMQSRDCRPAPCGYRRALKRRNPLEVRSLMDCCLPDLVFHRGAVTIPEQEVRHETPPQFFKDLHSPLPQRSEAMTVICVPCWGCRIDLPDAVYLTGAAINFHQSPGAQPLGVTRTVVVSEQPRVAQQ